MSGALRWLVPALAAALAGCASLAPGWQPGRDAFAPDALEDYQAYSDAGSGWRVSAGTLLGNGRALQSVLIRRGITMRDGWVETVTGGADDAGLVLRFQDNENYDLLAIRDDASPWPRPTENLRIYSRRNGRFVVRWTGDIAWRRGVRHRVRFAAQGDRLRVYLDGELAGSVADADPLPAGGFGLRHYGADAKWQSSFQAFRWQEQDQTSRPSLS